MSSKKELRELRKLAEIESERSASKNNTVKWVAISVSAVAFVIFFGMLVVNLKEAKVETTAAQLSSVGWVRGATESAKLTLTEFSDLQCPSCAAAEPYVQQLLQEHGSEIKFVYRHFPLPGHKNAMAASKAVEAAGKQGKFWEMHDELFLKQAEWQDENNPKEKYTSYAKELGLDVEKFNTDFDGKDIEEKINKDRDEGIKLGVNSTPTFYINGKKANLNKLSDIQKLVEEEL